MKNWWIFLILVAGCSEARGNPRTVTAEPELVSATEAAVARWNAAAGLSLEVVSAGGDVRVLRTKCENPEAWGCGGHRVARIAEPPSGYLELTVTHELAHALGAEHLADGELGIMQTEGLASPGCITAQDIVSICSGHTDCTAFVPEC